MSFKTKLDFGNDNRQAKQFQFSEIILSGKTTFGVTDNLIPENFTGDTINIEARQYIKSGGLMVIDGTEQDGYVLTSDVNGKASWKSVSAHTINDYVTTSSFSASTGDLILDRLSGGTVTTNLDGRYSLTNHTHNLSDLNNDIGFITGYTGTNDNIYVTGGTFNSELIEFTNISGGTFNVDLSNTYSLTGHTHSLSDLSSSAHTHSEYLTSFTDNFITGATFNTIDGILTLSGVTGNTVTVDLDGRYTLTGTTPDLTNSVGVVELKPELKSTVALAGLNIDWNLGIQFTYTMTSATSLTFSNILQGKTITLVIDGNHTLTLPTGVNTVDLINFDGTKTNYIQIYCVDSTTPIFLAGLKNY